MSSYQKYLAERKKEKPRLNETDLTYIRKAIYEEASKRKKEVVVSQNLFGGDYHLVVGDYAFGGIAVIYVDVVLPDTYTVEEVVELVNSRNW